jgi:serine/threonine protein kinase
MVRISNDLPDFTGRLVGCRYSLHEILGSGAYGVVHRAHDRKAGPHQNAQVAVKCLRNIDTSTGASFRRETAIHELVSGHTNVLALRNIVYEDWYIFIVLDLMEGGDLFGNIVQQRMFWKRDDLIRFVFLQICDGVQHAHSLGVAHRDLKPENILCSPKWHVVIADWGLATRSSITENRGCGSAFYMSPGENSVLPINIFNIAHDMSSAEAFNDGLRRMYCPQRSDIWSLGVILINLITGRCPWQRAEICDTSFLEYVDDVAHNRWNGQFLRYMLPISAAANDLLKRILVINPDQRISIQDIKDRVRNIDTFFMSSADVARGTQHVRGIVEEHHQHFMKTFRVSNPSSRRFAATSGVVHTDSTRQRPNSVITVACSLRSRSPSRSDASSRSSRPSSRACSRGPRTPPSSNHDVPSVVIADAEQAHLPPTTHRVHPRYGIDAGMGSPSVALHRMRDIAPRPCSTDHRGTGEKLKRESSFSVVLNKTIKRLKALA